MNKELLPIGVRRDGSYYTRVLWADVTENDLSFYVGKTGRAATVLRPAGMGEFEGVKLNV